MEPTNEIRKQIEDEVREISSQYPYKNFRYEIDGYFREGNKNYEITISAYDTYKESSETYNVAVPEERIMYGNALESVETELEWSENSY